MLERRSRRSRDLNLAMLLLLAIQLASCGQATDTTADAEDAGQPEQATRPNILLIVVDDMAYSDLGAWGGEARTPVLDDLAATGVRFSNFHAHMTCSPARAMLLSGTDNHIAGIGAMAEAMRGPRAKYRGKPGYEGTVNEDVVLFPRILQPHYRTLMTGKWHLGDAFDVSPAAHGFDRSFALTEGGAHHFGHRAYLPDDDEETMYLENGLPSRMPDDAYSTHFYTDRMIQYLDETRATNKPFFAYLALTAPHFPLQAPAETMQKYRGLYENGYAATQASRLAGLRARGLIDESLEPADFIPGITQWAELSSEEQLIAARSMEAYTAMIDEIDQQIGRLLDHLRETGEYDNTVVFFMSDNGAAGRDVRRVFMSRNSDWFDQQGHDNSLDNIGKRNSYVYLGAGWGWATGAPFRMFKGYSTEGGVIAAMFVRDLRQDADGRTVHGLTSIKDIMPTVLEYAGVAVPETVGEQVLQELEGASLRAVVDGTADSVHGNDYMLAYELHGRKALIRGDWKALFSPDPFHDGEWQLYNIGEDRAEMNDLAEEHPELLTELVSEWDAWARSHRVLEWE